MAVLHQHSFCPHSRFVRLALAEMGLDADLEDARPWQRDETLLLMTPSGAMPVLCDDEVAIPGASLIAEYLDETRGQGMNGRRLMPADPVARVEVRRLLDWFNGKFFDEVTGHLVTEKIFKRFGGDSPDAGAIRVARANIRYHLRYIGYLSSERNWLAGRSMSFADLAAAAHLSCADYLGDVPWDEDETAKEWYARVKSRPAFRALLGDRIPGMAPPGHYGDLDF